MKSINCHHTLDITSASEYWVLNETYSKSDYILQGSVVTRFGYDGIFTDRWIENLLQNILLKKFW